MRIAIVNCEQLPEPDLDHEPLSAAFRSAGVEPVTVAWDGPDAQRLDCDAYVLRATWNYYHHLDAFLEWTRRIAAASILINPVDVVAWNSDKRYLSELAQQGATIVPTEFIAQRESPARLEEICRRRGWNRVVVKPTISAASFATRSFENDLSAGESFLAEHLPRRSMMVQPFLESTLRQGEKSVAWIGGNISHAWIKFPRFAGESERVQSGAEITAADRELTSRVLSGFADQIDYARIDIMYNADNQPCLSELELIEPSLYFDFQPGSAAQFVAAVLRRIG